MLDKKLLKAKIELMTRSVFLSTINLSVKHIISNTVATAGTDCKQIMYNPDFCKNLSIIELTGLMAHECWHIAFMHKLRQGDRNHVLWNKAADYVINNMLLDSGYTLPPGGLADKIFIDMSTEQVYDALLTNNESQEEYELLDLLDTEGNAEEATEAIKIITEVGNVLDGRLIVFDALKMTFKELKLNKDNDRKNKGKEDRLNKNEIEDKVDDGGIIK